MEWERFQENTFLRWRTEIGCLIVKVDVNSLYKIAKFSYGNLSFLKGVRLIDPRLKTEKKILISGQMSDK